MNSVWFNVDNFVNYMNYNIFLPDASFPNRWLLLEYVIWKMKKLSELVKGYLGWKIENHTKPGTSIIHQPYLDMIQCKLYP